MTERPYKSSDYVIPTDFDYEIHGPMWQFECLTCGFMGDAFPTQAEAQAEADFHECAPMPKDGWKFRTYQMGMGQ